MNGGLAWTDTVCNHPDGLSYRSHHGSDGITFVGSALPDQPSLNEPISRCDDDEGRHISVRENGRTEDGRDVSSGSYQRYHRSIIGRPDHDNGDTVPLGLPRNDDSDSLLTDRLVQP